MEKLNKKNVVVFVFIFFCNIQTIYANEEIESCEIINMFEESTVEIISAKKDMMLGIIYRSSSFDCVDEEKSFMYLSRSSNMGNVNAQYHLCNYYSDRHEMIDAVKWCYIASSNGHVGAKSKIIFFDRYLSKEIINKGVEEAEHFEIDGARVD